MPVLRSHWLLLSLLVLNVLLKWFSISDEAIALDEPFSIYHAQMPVSDLLYHLSAYNNPPLFELLLHYWIHLFGISAPAVRFLPMLFSVAAVAVLFRMSKTYFNSFTAVVACLLFTFSDLELFYAHDCRAYALFLLLTLLAMQVFLHLMHAPENFKWHNSLALLLLNLALVYTHYFGWIVIGLQGMVLLLFFRKPVLLKVYGLVFILDALLYAPQWLILKERFLHSAAHGTWVKPPEGAESIYNMFWSFSNAPVITVFCLLILLTGLVMAFKKRGSGNRYAAVLWLWLLVPMLGMFLVSYKIPMFLDRYLLFVTPAYYLLLPLAIQHYPIPKKWQYTLAGLLVIGFALSFQLHQHKKRDIRECLATIGHPKDKNQLLMICPVDAMPAFCYYYKRDYFQKTGGTSEYGRMDSLLQTEHIYFVNGMGDDFSQIAKQHPQLVYLDMGADFILPDNTVRPYLDQHFQRQSEAIYSEFYRLYTYVTQLGKQP